MKSCLHFNINVGLMFINFNGRCIIEMRESVVAKKFNSVLINSITSCRSVQRRTCEMKGQGWKFFQPLTCIIFDGCAVQVEGAYEQEACAR